MVLYRQQKAFCEIIYLPINRDTKFVDSTLTELPVCGKHIRVTSVILTVVLPCRLSRVKTSPEVGLDEIRLKL
jgi:hypothetical protein